MCDNYTSIDAAAPLMGGGGWGQRQGQPLRQRPFLFDSNFCVGRAQTNGSLHFFIVAVALAVVVVFVVISAAACLNIETCV